MHWYALLRQQCIQHGLLWVRRDDGAVNKRSEGRHRRVLVKRLCFYDYGLSLVEFQDETPIPGWVFSLST